MSNKENLSIYRKCAIVPKEAQKTIQGGRIKGFTDINAMWRIRKLTEMFGPVGIGWYYEILEERLEQTVNEEVLAFVRVNFYYKHDGEWSKPIQGTGGNKMVTKEKNGLYVSDECFKMALTDALSVCCKALGMGSTIYWQEDKSKYDNPTTTFDINTNSFYALASSLNYNDDLVKRIIETRFKVKSITELTEAQYHILVQKMKDNPQPKQDK